MAFQDTVKALSGPVRREILTLLRKGKMSAGEIGAEFDMTGGKMRRKIRKRKTKSENSRMKMAKNLFLCLVAILMIGCSEKSSENKYLEQLEEFLENNPDSAQNVINMLNIYEQHNEFMPKADRIFMNLPSFLIILFFFI